MNLKKVVPTARPDWRRKGNMNLALKLDEWASELLIKGEKKGLKKAEKKGEKKVVLRMIQKMVEINLDDEIICKVGNITLRELNDIKKKSKKEKK